MSVSMLSEQLAAAGIDIEVFTTTANGKAELPVNPGERIEVDGVGVTYFKRVTKDHSHFSPAMLAILWKRVKDFDVVHIHAWWNLVSIFSCMVALMRGVPVVVSPRGTLSEYSFQNKNIGVKKMIHRLFGKPLLDKCSIHVTSDQELHRIQNSLKPKLSFNLPNFVKLPEVTFLLKPQKTDHLKLIFLSRIEEKKGLDLLITALPSLNFSFSLTIVGDGEANYVNSLKALAENNGTAKYIHWAGFQSDNKFELLAKHDLFVLPSYNENFGNSVIESLNQGTAVLISKTTGLADYVTDNNLGWLCEPDPASISEQLNIINDNRSELARIRDIAPEKIREDYNDADLTKRYIEMYKLVIANV
jgi:glycosyltransferase involved in cell wall biosynthesis